MTKKHDEALREILDKVINAGKEIVKRGGWVSGRSDILFIDQAIQQIRDPGFIHTSEAVLDEGKMLKVLSILNRTTMFVTDKMRVHALAQAGINELGKE